MLGAEIRVLLDPDRSKTRVWPALVPLNSSGKESGQMATGDVAVGAPGAGSSAALQTPTSKRIINDFSIQVATVNGSGSQSANLVLLKSIFAMGIPESGKNLVPSNMPGNRL